MNMGIGYSEIILIVMLILIFFGAKEIPAFMRQAAQFISKFRMYTDKVKREFSEIAKIDEPPMPSYEQETIAKKEVLRKKHIALRKELTTEQRAQKSKQILDILIADPAFVRAKAVMIYIDIGSEVQTRTLIATMLSQGKRVIVPSVNDAFTLGIAEIKDVDKDTFLGMGGMIVPRTDLVGNFLKSDIQLVVCPGVAFDIYGARLGRGKGSYDKFNREIKGRVTLIGLAYECQIMPKDERIPFSYEDVIMDQVISEKGYLIKTPEQDTLPELPTDASGV